MFSSRASCRFHTARIANVHFSLPKISFRNENKELAGIKGRLVKYKMVGMKEGGYVGYSLV